MEKVDDEDVSTTIRLSEHNRTLLFDFIVIQEPGLLRGQEKLVELKDYFLYSSLHSSETSREGGLILYLHRSIKEHVLSVQTNDNSCIDIIWIEFDSWYLCFLYLPPVNSTFINSWPHHNPITTLMEQYDNLPHRHKQVLMIGDFNSRMALPPDKHSNKWGTTLKHELIRRAEDNMTSTLRIEVPGQFTFIGSTGCSTIDFAITDSALVSPIQCLPHLPHISDHVPIHIQFQAIQKPKMKQFPYRTLDKALKAEGLLKRQTTVDKAEMELLSSITPPSQPTPSPFPSLLPNHITTPKSYSHHCRLYNRLYTKLRVGGTLNETEEKLYRTAKSFLNAHRQRKRRHRQLTLRQKMESLKAYPNRYWAEIKKVIRRIRIIEADPQAALEHCRDLSAQDEEETQLNSETIQHPRLLSNKTSQLEPLVDTDLTADEISNMLKRMHNSANGEDRISASQIKTIDPGKLAEFFQLLTKEGDVPSTWKRGIAILLPKGNKDTSQPNNLRTITLQPRLKRLFTLCLTERITQWSCANTILPPSQNGFRTKHRTGDNIFLLRILKETHDISGTPLFLCSADVSKAFDRVSRPLLFDLLSTWGLNGRLMETLKAMYSDNKTTLRLDNRHSAFYPSERGVAQGDPLSPLLFIIYISCLNLHDPDDPLMGLDTLGEMLLADDIVLLSTSVDGLNRKIATLNQQLSLLGLKLNPEKSVFFPLFKAGRFPVKEPHLNDIPIPQQSKITINGYILDSRYLPEWDCVSTMEKRIKEATDSSRDLQLARSKLGLSSPRAFLDLYLVLVESRYTYALESMLGAPLSLIDKADTQQRRMIRHMTGVHEKATTAVLSFDLKLTSMITKITKRCFKMIAYITALEDEERPIKRALYQSMLNWKRCNHGWFASLIYVVRKMAHRMDYYEGKLNNKVDNNCIPDQHLNPNDRNAMQTFLAQAEHLLDKNEKWQARELVANSSRLKALSQLVQWEYKERAPYLQLDKKLARNFARLRSSSHNGAIERYRIQTRYKKENERYCPICTPNTVEDEKHIFLECTDHDRDRSEWLSNFKTPLTDTQIMHHVLLPEGKHLTHTAKFVKHVMDRIDARYVEEESETGPTPFPSL